MGFEESAKIIDVIRENPGIKFNEILRKTGLKNGALSYRLSQLEEGGVLKIERTPGATRCYPLGLSDEETILIKHLRQRSSSKIISLLTENNHLSFRDVVKMSKFSSSSVSITMSKLVSEGIVDIFFEKRTKFYKIEKKNVIRKVINKYNFDLLDGISKHKSSFTSVLLVLFGLSQKFIIDGSMDFILNGQFFS